MSGVRCHTHKHIITCTWRGQGGGPGCTCRTRAAGCSADGRAQGGCAGHGPCHPARLCQPGACRPFCSKPLLWFAQLAGCPLLCPASLELQTVNTSARLALAVRGQLVGTQVSKPAGFWAGFQLPCKLLLTPGCVPPSDAACHGPINAPIAFSNSSRSFHNAKHSIVCVPHMRYHKMQGADPHVVPTLVTLTRLCHTQSKRIPYRPVFVSHKQM